MGSAHYVLGAFGSDSDLRRYAQKMAARGGKNSKKQAAVVTARKLAVLLHRLWFTGELYDPLHDAQWVPREANGAMGHTSKEEVKIALQQLGDPKAWPLATA